MSGEVDVQDGGDEGGRTSRHPVELELKFRVRDLAAGERYLLAEDVAGFAQAAPTHTAQVEDHYLDTADGALARAGFAARLRYGTRTTIVTVKSTAGGDSGTRGLHRREEIEGPADRTLRAMDWPTSDARSLILELGGDDPLVELVTVRQLRRTRGLRSGGTLVELSLDEVDVLVRSAVVERFTELEVELVRGDEARLRDLGEALAADPALEPATESKLEAALLAVRSHASSRGDAASRDAAAGQGRRPARTRDEPGARSIRAASHPRARPNVDEERTEAAETARPASAPTPAETHPIGSEPPPAASKQPGVTGDDSIAEAGRKVLRFQFARMLARERGTREGSDPEDLHAMRVATRRMRAAWRVFGDGFRPGRTRRYRRRLRQVAARLGAVRDLDVLLEGATTYLDALPETEASALEPLLAAWRSYRDDARVLLLHELDSRGYARFVEDYRVFVQTEGAGVRPIAANEPHRVRDTTPARAWQAYEQVRAYEPVLRWATVETLHELRIAAKWLRYTLEFVREPLGADAGPLIAAVTDLQDHLGRLHDADVAASMARAFLVERASTLDPGETAAIGRYLVAREREVAELHRTVGRPWRGVAGLGFRTGLGKVVAAL